MTCRAISAVVLASVVAVVGAGCYQQGVRANDSWWELKSTHFVMRTNIGREAAEQRIAALEDQFWALVEVYRQLLPQDSFTPPDDVTQVIVFDTCDPVAELAGNHAGFAGTGVDYSGRRVIVTCENAPHPWQRFMHELTHVFNGRALGRSPVWLEEGLAEYFETIDVDGKDVIIGRPNIMVQSLHGHEVTFPTIDKLLVAEWPDFHYGMQEVAFYIASRNLVSALIGPGERHRRFLAYLHLLASGAARPAAWQEAFGSVGLDDLGERMRLEHTRAAIVQRVPHTSPPGQAAPVVTRARTGDIYADWVNASLMTHARDPAPLLADIDAAEKADPTWPEGNFWRAVILLDQPSPDRARCISWLRAQIERTPDDERPRTALLLTETADAKPPVIVDASASEPPVSASLVAAEPDALALAKQATSATGLNDVAWYFARRRMPAVGLGFARRALERDPSCAYCKDTLALLLAEDHHFAEALTAEEEAIHGLGDSEPPKGMVERRARYRELAARTAH